MISAVPFGTGPRTLRYPALRAGLLSGRPCGTLGYKQLSQLGGWKVMHFVPNGCGSHPSMIQPSRQSLDRYRKSSPRTYVLVLALNHVSAIYDLTCDTQ